MDDQKSSLVNHLTAVDTKIQKILWVQLIIIIIYGLLFVDGLETKRQSDELKQQLKQSTDLRARFAWLDSLATVFVKYPTLAEKYQSYFDEFDYYLSRLENLQTGTLFYNTVFDYLIKIDSEWRNAQSTQIVNHIQNLTNQGENKITQQLNLVNSLRQSPSVDSLLNNTTLLEAMKPLPTFLDTLRLLIINVYSRPRALREPIQGLSDFLSKNDHPLNLPSDDSIEQLINDVKLFTRTHELESDRLGTLEDYQNVLADSMRAMDHKKGTISLAFVQQDVSVKFAFKFGLPLLIFFNHLLLLLLRKKATIHKVFLTDIMDKTAGALELSVHLSPIFLNFLFTHDSSQILKIMTWIFFFILELAVLLLGGVIFWYQFAYLPTSEAIPLVTLIIMSIFLLIHIFQIFGVYVLTVKIKS